MKRTYVLDTSVLLSAGAKAFTAFEEHDLVLPVAVLEELEIKRHHPDLGFSAREVLRRLEELRVRHGALTGPLPVNDMGGTVRVELNHQDPTALPPPLRGSSADHRILAVARNLSDEGANVVLVTKDLPLRLRASVAGVTADEYRNEQVVAEAWTGVTRMEVPAAVINALYRDLGLDVADLSVYGDLAVNAGVVMTSGSQSALARVHPDKIVRPLVHDVHLGGVSGRSAEQKIALSLLADPDLGVVSLGGPAGTGKSVMALAAGIDAVTRLRTHRRIMVFRPIYAVGGQDLGYLPGTASEKMAPWGDAVNDALEAITAGDLANVMKSKGSLEVLPLTHIRGRSLTDTFVIIDEAQNLERSVLLTALSRLGEGSKAVMTHDVAQRDNLRVGRHDGISAVVASLKGHPLFGHVTLTKSERSPVSAMVSELLDEG